MISFYFIVYILHTNIFDIQVVIFDFLTLKTETVYPILIVPALSAYSPDSLWQKFLRKEGSWSPEPGYLHIRYLLMPEASPKRVMAMARIPSVIIRNMDMAHISLCSQNGLPYVSFLNIHMYSIQMKKNSFIIMASQIFHSISYPD